MNRDLLQSYIRIALTSLGAILAKHGIIDAQEPSVIEAWTGLICIIASAAWSAKHQESMKTITEEERQTIIKESEKQ